MTDPVSPEPSRAPLSQRLLAWVQHRRLLSDARLLQLYPPF